MPADIAEVLFYHLERSPLDGVLPALVEKTLARGWRAVVQAGSAERVEALDQLLWTFNEGSFVPHGAANAGNSAHQPVFLTTEPENPNRAAVRFMVDGALLDDIASHINAYKRIVFMFDGNNSDELAQARATWKAVKATSAALTYWQQSESGGWEKKA